MSIIYDYAEIAKRINPRNRSHYDEEADRWARAANNFQVEVAASLQPYIIEDDWDDESKDGAMRVNARRLAAKRLLGLV